MMRNPERANTIIANTIGMIGFALVFFGGLTYFFMQDTWQIVLAFVGIGLMLVSLYADN